MQRMPVYKCNVCLMLKKRKTCLRQIYTGENVHRWRWIKPVSEKQACCVIASQVAKQAPSQIQTILSGAFLQIRWSLKRKGNTCRSN